jgi:hypothetical protein
VNIWNDDNFASLTPAQRRAVEARAAADGQSPVEYLNGLGAGLAAVSSYVEEDEREDAETFAPFFDKARQCSDAGLAAVAVFVRETAAAEGLDVSDLDALISGFQARAEKQ